ncbi:MAG: heme exporter protein CcmD [Alphaproteobacteria bacterium]|nr:heme exporter protein CcmD [Alphaproteobacteria bacterium]
MDLSSPHIFFVGAAYVLGIFVFTLLTFWVVKEDRKAYQELRQWTSDDT